MKSIRLLLFLLSPMILFLGCAKEKSFEVGGGASGSQWEFSQGSFGYKGKVDTAYKAEVAAGVTALLVEGTSDDGTGVITLGIIGLTPTGAGVYTSPNVLFDYSVGTGTVYQNDITAVGKFTIEITKMDSASVTGVFSGEVKDSTGATKTISNGKFSARFGTSGGGNPTVNGQLTLWAKTGCGSGGTGPIKVQLGNLSGNITSFMAAEPNCGAAGTVTFSVPPGSYSWMAICGTDTIRKVVNIGAGQCIKDEVSFAAQPPAPNMWTFRDATSNKTFTGTFDGPGVFTNDIFGTGKALYMTGTVGTSDTTMDLYITFPANATQPIPGTYITIPDFSDKSNNNDWYLYDGSTGDYFYYVRENFTPPLPPAGLKLTIIITSYDPTTKVVKGTFSGKSLNAVDQLIDITGGVFEGTVQF